MSTMLAAFNLGKKYKHYSKRWHRLLEWMPGLTEHHRSTWALRGVSLSVRSGEAVGIIGQNGSGKSTLLKILTGTTAATEGNFYVQGSLSSLLELGLGFHPAFTGRQNACLTGLIMGYDRGSMEKMMEGIKDFAEIDDYLDRPLRTYSSGMVVRLAFASATAVRPDLLLVDEALAVGDVYFQHKCYTRIRQYKQKGTALVFVSHDPVAIKSLCDRAILLDEGLPVKEGPPGEVLDYYNAVIARREAEYRIRQEAGPGRQKSTRSGSGAARIESVEIYCRGNPTWAVRVGETVQVKVRVKVEKELFNPTVGILFKDHLGNDLYGTNTFFLNQDTGPCHPGERLEFIFNLPLNFGVGVYSLSAAVHRGATHMEGNYDWWDQAATMQVVRGEEAVFTGSCYIGAVTVQAIRLERVKTTLGGNEHAAT